MGSKKRQKDTALEDEPPGRKVSNMLPQRAVTGSSRKKEAVGPKQERHSAGDALVVKANSDAVKSARESTWEVRSVNRGKLDVVKQEMATN